MSQYVSAVEPEFGAVEHLQRGACAIRSNPELAGSLLKPRRIDLILRIDLPSLGEAQSRQNFRSISLGRESLVRRGINA
jgi:hypothetical protein